jgi:hypothetical protein
LRVLSAGAGRRTSLGTIRARNLPQPQIPERHDHAAFAKLNVWPNFSYLSPADAEIFLTKIWRNPPGAGERTLGLLLPKDIDVLGSDGWAIVIQ